MDGRQVPRQSVLLKGDFYIGDPALVSSCGGLLVGLPYLDVTRTARF